MDQSESTAESYRHFQGPFFSLSYPESWEAEVIENIPAFFDPMSGGALQVVATRSDGEPFDLQEEMKKYLDRMEIEFDADRLHDFGHPSGDSLACEFIKDDRFWFVYMITNATRLLVVLYNADEVPQRSEIETILHIISTIRMAPE